MAFIEPLALETWLVNVFSGGFVVFTSIAVLTIAMLGAYFRMTGMIVVFMIGLFFVMFTGFVDQGLLFLIITIGGLMLGYWLKELSGR